MSAIQSEQFFRAIFEQVAIGIALIDTTTGRFIRANQRYLDMMGVSLAEMTALTFMAITYPDDLPADLDRMEELKTGRIRNFSMEKRLLRSDGSIVWVDLTVAPLWEVGEPPNFHIAVVQDISKRKEVEQHLLNLNVSLEHQVVQRTRELEEGRQQLQAIVEGTSDAMFLKDVEGRYLVCNAAAGRFIGKLPHEILGQDDSAVFLSPDAQALREDDRQIMAIGVTKTYEETITTADGVQRTFLTTKGPVFDSQNHVTGLFGIARDVSERKQVEAQLRESELRFRALVERIGDVFWISDPSTRKLVYVSQTFADIWGRRPEDLYDRFDTWLDAIHDDDRARVTTNFFGNILVGTYDTEYRVMRPDGSIRWVRDRGKPLGVGNLVAGMAQDITDRKKAEEVLRESEERFRNIFEHAGTGIAILDLEGRFLKCNPSYCTLIGYTEVEFRELDYKQVVHPEDLGGILAERERLYVQEVPFVESEGRYQHRDGEAVWVSKFTSLLRDAAGHPTNLFVLVTDITDRRRMQEILEQRIVERTEELRKQAEQLSQTLTITRSGAWDWDITTGAVHFDEAWLDLLGYGRGEIRPHISFWEQLIHPEDLSKVRGAVRKHFEGHSEIFECNYRLRTKDGNYRWSRDRGRVVERTADGDPLRMVGLDTDITEQKMMEEALDESEARYRTLFESIDEGLSVIELLFDESGQPKDYRFLEVNPAFKKQTGIFDVVGRCVREIIPTLEEHWFQAYGRVAITGEPIRFQSPAAVLHRWYDVYAFRIGRPEQRRVAVLFNDITKRKLAEEALRDSYQRLQVLSRDVQLAEERERSRLSRELHDEFGQLLSVLKFDLGRITNGVTKTSPLPRTILGRKLADASNVVDQLFSSLRELIRGLRPALLEELGLVAAFEALAVDVKERSGLSCQLALDDGEGRLSLGAEIEGALYRIAQELLTNVMRHAAAKNVSVSLQIEEKVVCLTVKDDGRGMSKTQRVGRDHYGLRGIRERVELLGGQVEIRSGRSRGTMVTVCIPVKLPLINTHRYVESDRARKFRLTRKGSRRGR